MFDNAQRLKTAAASLKKCGVNTSGFEAKMEKFQLEDVTEAMYWFMRVAKEYGQERAREFLKLEINPYDYAMTHFVDLVNNGAVYDIKIQPLFKRHHQYYFDGYVIDFDDTGNILYGVYGMAMFNDVFDGSPEIIIDKTSEAKKFLHTGAGANNFWSAVRNGGIRAIPQELMWIPTYCDDPRDYEAIELGFEYYHEID